MTYIHKWGSFSLVPLLQISQFLHSLSLSKVIASLSKPVLTQQPDPRTLPPRPVPRSPGDSAQPSQPAAPALWRGSVSDASFAAPVTVTLFYAGGPELRGLPLPKDSTTHNPLPVSGLLGLHSIEPYVSQVLKFSKKRILLLTLQTAGGSALDDLLAPGDRAVVVDLEQKRGLLLYLLPPSPSRFLSNTFVLNNLLTPRPEGCIWAMAFLAPKVLERYALKPKPFSVQNFNSSHAAAKALP